MKLKEEHMSDLSNIINVISKVRGVVGIFLFGSLARGDHDQYSDFDLLVLFEDKASMWQNWDELFQATSSLKMNLHVIPQTIEELKAANPVFLDELFKHGIVLFAKLPLKVFPKPLKLEPFSLIFYDMSGLRYRDKMKVLYFLYRKGGEGAIAKMEGIKIAEGCILIPSDASDEIISALSAFGVDAKKLEIYTSEDQLKAWISQRPTITSKKT